MEPNETVNPSNSTPHAPRASGMSPWTEVAIIALVVLELAVAMWHEYPRISGLFAGHAPEASNPSTVSGKLYLSLLAPTADDSGVMGVSAFDFKDGSLSPVPPLFDAGGVTGYYSPVFSPDGSKVAYASYVATSSQPARMYVANADGSDPIWLMQSTSTPWARSPSWSPDGTLVAFAAWNQKFAPSDDVNPSGWNIYVYDLKGGKGRLVTSGSSPLFVPDGRLLALKSDGLHLIDLSSDADELVWKTEEGKAGANMKLAVSKDGTKIAWTIFDHVDVVLLDVASWKPFSATIGAEYPVAAFWPVFSPDGKWLALQLADPDTSKNARIDVVNLATGERQRAISLFEYDPLTLFLSDWR